MEKILWVLIFNEDCLEEPHPVLTSLGVLGGVVAGPARGPAGGAGAGVAADEEPGLVTVVHRVSGRIKIWFSLYFCVDLRAAASVATIKGRKAGFDVGALVDDLSWVRDVPGLNLGLDLLSDDFLEGAGLD